MAYDVLTPRERWHQQCREMTPDDLVTLEGAMLKYFTNNENSILTIQRQYQEIGRAIDVVTATEYALRLDLHTETGESRKRIHALESVLQYLMAVRIARKKSDQECIGDFEVIQELKTVSQKFRPDYMEEIMVVEGFLEDHARVMQQKFMEIVERDRVA